MSAQAFILAKFFHTHPGGDPHVLTTYTRASSNDSSTEFSWITKFIKVKQGYL